MEDTHRQRVPYALQAQALPRPGSGLRAGTPPGTQAHRLSSPPSNNLTTRKQCRVRVYAPVILLGTGNAGCGSEQAAVGSPLGDCRPCHHCPTQIVSSHQRPLLTAEGCPWGHQLPCTSRHRLVARGTSRPRTHSKKLLLSRATESDKACGLVTTLPKQMPLWGESRHPTGLSLCGQAQTSFKNDPRPHGELGTSRGLPSANSECGSHGPKLVVRSDSSLPGSVHIA